MTAVATYPASVARLIEALDAGAREALGDCVAGIYLCGSLALGGFDPETSDVDMLVVLERPVTDAEFARLKVLHDRLPPGANEFSRDYDVYYIDLATIRRFAPGQRHVKVGTGEPMHRGEHRSNWVLERWVVREYGVTVVGPDPKSLIDPVSADALRAAALDELTARLDSWSEGTWPRDELSHRGAQAFEVETVCRALCTIATARVPTKQEAVQWALASLPPHWHSLIEWSEEHRKDVTQDNTKIDEVLGLLDWALSSRGR